MLHARETTITLFLWSYLPLSRNCTHPCALHNFDTVRDILIMFVEM